MPTDRQSFEVALRSIARQREQLEAEEVEIVRRMRRLNWSWRHVGLVFGITRQAAQQRFGPAL